MDISEPMFSRFVIWDSAPETMKKLEPQPLLRSLLTKLGFDHLEEIHGLESSLIPEHIKELECILRQHDLGMLAHGYMQPDTLNKFAPNSVLDKSFHILGLSVRATNCLTSAGIATIGDLVQKSESELLAIPSMGRLSLAEIQQSLSLLGLNRADLQRNTVNEFVPTSVLDQSFHVLGLSVRPTNCLTSAGIATIGDLIQWSESELLAITSMGRLSVAEIQRSLSLLGLKGDETSSTPCDNGDFSLALIMTFEQTGISEETASQLRSLDFADVHDLLTKSSAVVRQRIKLGTTEARTLQRLFAKFQLRLSSEPPAFISNHLREFRTAFREDIKRVIDAEETAIDVGPAVQSSMPLFDCLEMEFENWIPSKVRDKRLPLIRKVLGWDGSPGATLEEAGREFGLTRERVRQIVSQSIGNQPFIQTSLLSQAIAFLVCEAPCAADQAEAALLAKGMVHSPIRVEGIFKTAREVGIDVPLQTVEENSFRAVLTPQDAVKIREFQTEARRRISHFGTTTISYILAELLANEITEDLADLSCRLTPDIKWLDEDHQWFWMPTRRNPVSSRLAKILRVAPKLDIKTALAAVLRDRRMEGVELTIEVFTEFCGVIPWCKTDKEFIFAGDGIPDEEEQDSNETTIRRVLEGNGGVMWRQALWSIASRQGVEHASFVRNLAESNILVKLAREVYALIGVTEVPTDLEQHTPQPLPSAPSIDSLQPVGLHAAESERLLEGCDPIADDFPIQLLKRIILKSKPLRQQGVWSLAELRWAEKDLECIRQWSNSDAVDLKPISRQAFQFGNGLVDGVEAVALTFLVCCSDHAMNLADESSMWFTVQSAFAPRLRSQLFQGPGIPKSRIRDATERICSKLKVRHVFGREGEQSWRRTLFLQFGITKLGRQRLPLWLTGHPVPVAVEELLSSGTLSSESFGDFWRILQKYRQGQVSHERAASALARNPWVPVTDIEDVLSASLARVDFQQSNGVLTGTKGDNGHILDAPVLSWRGELPFFDLTLRTRSHWLTEPRYVLVLNNGKRVTATRHGDEYKLDGRLQVDLSDEEVTVDLCRNQVSCLPQPLCVRLVPEDHDLAFFDLVTGELLPYENEKFTNGSYALLARSFLEVNIEPIEIRRVFGGAWILRAFRNGIPPNFEIHSNGQVAWTISDVPEANERRQVSRFRVSCTGGRWGSPATFNVHSHSDVMPTHLLLDGKRFPLEFLEFAGTGSASVILSAGLDYKAIRVRVECILNNRVRWFGADLTMGPIEGIAIDTEAGWKVFKETADMDAEYLMHHSILTSLPARFQGDAVSSGEWAFMEGSHFCGRPELSARTIGGDLHAVGAPLRISPRPYNQLGEGYDIARSVIHSGVVNWIDTTDGFWRIQLRRTFELGQDHELWVWPARAEMPIVLERSAWWQEETICYALVDSAIAPIAFAISYEGVWLGARTGERGWAAFGELLSCCENWEVAASWLKWWRVPLLHPDIKLPASVLAKTKPIETIRAWSFRYELSESACFSEDYEDSWRTVTRSFLWKWIPSQSESIEILQTLGLLSGDFLLDLDQAWEGYEDLLATHPLLLAQLAARGASGLYEDNTDASLTFLNRLRNQLLEIDRSAPRDAVVRAMLEGQRMAAESMGVDEAFVSRSLLRDALAALEGNLKKPQKLRVALTNSYAAQRYIAAKILDSMIVGEIK